MLQPFDILHRIACRMYGYSGLDGASAVDEFLVTHLDDLSLAITDDPFRSERSFLARCGPGDTFYFKLESFQQGKYLAANLLRFVRGIFPDLTALTEKQFVSDDHIYLSVHVCRSPERSLGTWGTQDIVRIHSLN